MLATSTAVLVKGIPGKGADGKALFLAKGCATCHTFTPAGSTGTLGADLDKLPAEAQRAGRPLESFVRESIVNPNAYIEPKYQAGLMPQNFGTTLSKAELDALVTFLVQGSKGSAK